MKGQKRDSPLEEPTKGLHGKVRTQGTLASSRAIEHPGTEINVLII